MLGSMKVEDKRGVKENEGDSAIQGLLIDLRGTARYGYV
jgi:hypothetical protein